jgi:hypothetical protein
VSVNNLLGLARSSQIFKFCNSCAASSVIFLSTFNQIPKFDLEFEKSGPLLSVNPLTAYGNNVVIVNPKLSVFFELRKIVLPP